MSKEVFDEEIKVKEGKPESESFVSSIIKNTIQEQLDKYNDVESVKYDPLRLYFGEDYIVNDRIIIKQPTIQLYIDIGEANVYAAIAPFTSNTTSCRVQLWDLGIDWNKITNYQLFAMLIKTMKFEYSKYLFKYRILKESDEETDIDVRQTFQSCNSDDEYDYYDIDFNKFEMYNRHSTVEGENGLEEKDELTLFYPAMNIEIDEGTYKDMAAYMQYMFNIHTEEEFASGKKFKQELIDNDRLKIAQRSKEKNKSSMLSLISFALNHPGFKYKKNELRSVGIVEFMDSVQRLQIYESTHALYGGMYSGFCDTSKIDKENFNFMRDISIS